MTSNWMDLNTVNLLGRVDSRVNKVDLINDLVKRYSLSGLESFTQIHEGFEDYNVKLNTKEGTFLVKIFSQYKSFRHIKDNIEGLKAFIKAGVRVPKLISDPKGNYLYKYENDQIMVLGCVMEYFKGKSFYKTKDEPTKKEIQSLVKDIALLNSVKFKPKGIYDVWVLQNLPNEFGKKKMFLTKQDLSLISPVVGKSKSLDLKKLTQGTIHNDIQRSNVLKNTKGDIRIIDFSVMEYNAISIELATFLALFCINPFTNTPEDFICLCEFVLKEYQKHKSLTGEDKQVIPLLIQSTYAANCLAASFEHEGKENKTEETKYWISLGRKGLELMQKVNKSKLLRQITSK